MASTLNASNPISISVLVLTHNEQNNLPYLLDSIKGWAKAIYIVDSGSSDETLSIAVSYGAVVAYNPWRTYADQFNWGLRHFDFETDWIMRMDADERVMPELASELQDILPGMPSEVYGLYVKRRVHFMGRWIKHGAFYPTWLLRIFRPNKGFCETRWMDEHIILTGGETRRLTHDIIDENHNGLRYFIIKHEGYANREMMDLLDLSYGLQAQSGQVEGNLMGEQDSQKRWLKGNLYSRAPIFWRALAYFIYRYVFRFGFLDGTEGLIFHLLQGLWYRFYVDAKIWEYKYRKPQNRNDP